ncbi:hypothetical protein GGP41_010592 [Bipolaris sorokiniana]|uniref:Delta(24(24(1)))-sterol reductase n=1 Tax=Cochliobolus sativus TaxID=45130 RepID=A0A8H5ZLC4_COCSA|nr:hypothetical protein GGP41_010592 [Bipolaris sorokiniana]
MSMRVTRSQAGKTPVKPERPGFVETPGRKRSQRRKSAVADADTYESTPEPEEAFAKSLSSTDSTMPLKTGHTNGHANGNGISNGHANGNGTTNGHVNGHANGHSRQEQVELDFAFEAEKFFPPKDPSGLHEFGGAIGMGSMMICFPALMYYMWIGAAFYDGKFPTRTQSQSWSDFFGHMWYLVKTEAYPNNKAWQIYWYFGLMQMTFYMFMPGQGASSSGRKATGLLLLSNVLNPRLFGILDFKMFLEVRIPWFILFFLSLGTCLKQYEQYGYVSIEAIFLLFAHYLYAGACAKGEHLIITTWDMYYEKLGFMLIFWNMAGVPLSYCHCTLYIAYHHPSEYGLPTWFTALLTLAYLYAYYIWDTTNSQKNQFRQEERGVVEERTTFPYFKYGRIENPKTIQTAHGNKILADGWYGKARKIHYTCDFFFAVSWGLITGFSSPFPWFYSVFFGGMIIHRAMRDIEKCREKYGEAWKEYERQVPYLFIPFLACASAYSELIVYMILIHAMLGGLRVYYIGWLFYL